MCCSVLFNHNKSRTPSRKQLLGWHFYKFVNEFRAGQRSRRGAPGLVSYFSRFARYLLSAAFRLIYSAAAGLLVLVIAADRYNYTFPHIFLFDIRSRDASIATPTFRGPFSFPFSSLHYASCTVHKSQNIRPLCNRFGAKNRERPRFLQRKICDTNCV